MLMVDLGYSDSMEQSRHSQIITVASIVQLNVFISIKKQNDMLEILCQNPQPEEPPTNYLFHKLGH